MVILAGVLQVEQAKLFGVGVDLDKGLARPLNAPLAAIGFNDVVAIDRDIVATDFTATASTDLNPCGLTIGILVVVPVRDI